MSPRETQAGRTKGRRAWHRWMQGEGRMVRTGSRVGRLRIRAERARRFRRGVYLLPSMFTVANLFCGYACVVYTTRGEYETAAPFIGIAIVLDMLDGRIARLTGTSSAFGLELDSLADVVSFGMAPAILAFGWGLAPLGRLGWAAGFIFVTAAAMRLARFNIQSPLLDKRFFVGMPSPAAAAVTAATVFAHPEGLQTYREGLSALAMVLVPALLMVSTLRFRSFKTVDLGWRRSYVALFLTALVIAAVTTHPRLVLAAMAYVYLMSPFGETAVTKLRRRFSRKEASAEESGVGQTAETSAPHGTRA